MMHAPVSGACLEAPKQVVELSDYAGDNLWIFNETEDGVISGEDMSLSGDVAEIFKKP